MSSANNQAGFVYAGLLLSGFAVLTGVLNYAFQLLMGKILSADDFLAFNAIIALSLVIGSPLSALQTVATRYVATVAATCGRGTVQQLFRLWVPRFWTAIVGVAVLVAAFSEPLQRWLQLPDTSSTWLFTTIVALNLLAITNNTVFQGLQRFFWLGIMPVANVLLRIICCGFIVGFLEWGLRGGLTGVACAAVICVVIGTAVVTREKPLRSVKCSVHPRFPYGLLPPVIAATFGLTSMMQIDLVLVERYFTPAVASQYALAAVLGKAVLYLPAGLVATLVPVAAAEHAHRQSGRHRARQAIIATLGLAGTAAFGCFLVGPWFVEQLYGKKYGDAGRLLAIYGPAMVPMAIALISHTYLVTRAHSIFSWVIVATAATEIGILTVWHPSLEAVLILLASLHTMLAALGLFAINHAIRISDV